MPKWAWVEEQARYRDLETGRFVSGAQVQEWGSLALDASSDAVAELADMLNERQLNVHDWTLLMRDEIKDSYIQEYLFGKGGLEQMTQADWGSIGGMLAEQYRYLDNFARQIADGTVTESQIVARARMYARSAKESFARAQRHVAMDRGMTQVKWVLHPAEHCRDCIAFAGLNWQNIEDDPYRGAIPGSGHTECLVNCACSLDYR